MEQDIKAPSLAGAIAGRLAAEPDAAAVLVLRRSVADTGATFEIAANLYPAKFHSVRTSIR